MSFIGRLVSTPVGLAAEAIQHSKDKKAAAAAAAAEASDAGESSSDARHHPQHTPRHEDKNNLKGSFEEESSFEAPPPAYDQATGSATPADDRDSSDLDEEEDAADWARDETQAELEKPENPKTEQELTNPHGVDKYVHQHVQQFPRTTAAPLHRLDVPVIIPQRRPESRMRGFVHAYAPVLEESDVSQEAFLHFLDGFSAVVRNQKYFWVANGAVAITGLAATAGAFLPSLVTQVAVPAIHWSVEGGRRVYESNAVNQYLDAMNRDFFKPRDLYALVMTYDPYSSAKAQQVSLEDNMLKAVSARDQHKINNLHQSSGHAAELQVPESAELVFPALEAASDGAKQSAVSRAGGFARDYLDKRARVAFDNQNPDAKIGGLYQDQPKFASSIADPNHAMWKGGILTILSGGKIPSRRQRHRERAEGRIDQYESMGIAPRRRDERVLRHDHDRTSRREMYRTAKKKGYTPIGFVKRNLGEHLVYLMIVPYPTEQQFAEAAEMEARAKAVKEGQRSS